MDSRLAATRPRFFETGSFASAPNFPAIGFSSFDQFQAWLPEHQPMLDARYRYEHSLGTRAPMLQQPGTCGPCLRPALFTSATHDGERTADGRRVPEWRRHLRCDCEDGLCNDSRALLHILLATGLGAWSRVLLFGGPGEIDARLRAMLGSVTAIPRLTRADDPPERFLLETPPAAFHIAVSQDYLHFIPPLPAALRAIAAVLTPGGHFVFTTDFRPVMQRSELMSTLHGRFEDGTPAEYAADRNIFGWDLLDMLRAAGFSEAAAYLFWSEELGYLGPMNFIFRATR